MGAGRHLDAQVAAAAQRAEVGLDCREGRVVGGTARQRNVDSDERQGRPVVGIVRTDASQQVPPPPPSTPAKDPESRRLGLLG